MLNVPNNKRDIFGLVALVAEIVLPAIGAGVSIFVDNTVLGVDNKIAILSITIGTSIVLMQFSIKAYYDSIQRTNIDLYRFLNQRIDTLHSEIELNEVYKKYLESDEELRPFIQTILESNNEIVKKYIEDRRTGALEISSYYKQLHICADKIIQDKNISTGLGKPAYAGEIWAMSSLLDDEWGNTGLEGAWVQKMLDADKQGIPTKRLYIFPQEKIKLLKETGPNNEQTEAIRAIIRDLVPYCDSSESSQYSHTSSFAIARTEFPENLLKVVGKGFFATKLSNGKLTLIRDVSIDNLSANNLGGEIDFNEDKIKETRESWERLIAAGTKLNDFLCEKIVPSETTKKVLVEFNILQEFTTREE